MTGQSRIKLETFSKWISLPKKNISCISGEKNDQKNFAKSCRIEENGDKRTCWTGQEGKSKTQKSTLKTFSRWIRTSETRSPLQKSPCKNDINENCLHKKRPSFNEAKEKETQICNFDISKCKKLKTFSKWINISKRNVSRVSGKCANEQKNSKLRRLVVHSEKDELSKQSMVHLDDKHGSLAAQKSSTIEKFKPFSRWISIQETKSFEKSHEENSLMSIRLSMEKDSLQGIDASFLYSESLLPQFTDMSIDLDSSFDETIMEKPRGSSTPKKKYQSKTNEEKSIYKNSETDTKLHRNLFPGDDKMSGADGQETIMKTPEGSPRKSFQTIVDEETGELFYLRDSLLLCNSPWTIKFGRNPMKPDWMVRCEKELDMGKKIKINKINFQSSKRQLSIFHLTEFL